MFFFCFVFFQFRISQVNFKVRGGVHCVGCDSDFSILFSDFGVDGGICRKNPGRQEAGGCKQVQSFFSIQKVLRRNALQVKVKEAGNKCHIEKPMGGLADFTTRNY